MNYSVIGWALVALLGIAYAVYILVTGFMNKEIEGTVASVGACSGKTCAAKVAFKIADKTKTLDMEVPEGTKVGASVKAYIDWSGAHSSRFAWQEILFVVGSLGLSGVFSYFAYMKSSVHLTRLQSFPITTKYAPGFP